MTPALLCPSAAIAAAKTTNCSYAVTLIAVVVDDEEFDDDRRRCRSEFLRRRKKKLFENGRSGWISFVVDRQRLSRNEVVMFRPSSSKCFVECPPGGQDFWWHVILRNDGWAWNVNELETGWEEVVWPEWQWLNRNHHQHLKKKVHQEQHRSSWHGVVSTAQVIVSSFRCGQKIRRRHQ